MSGKRCNPIENSIFPYSLIRVIFTGLCAILIISVKNKQPANCSTGFYINNKLFGNYGCMDCALTSAQINYAYSSLTPPV